MTDTRTPPPASHPDLDAAITQLKNGEAAWGSLLLRDRAALLRRTHTAVARTAELWVETACRIKGIAPDSQLAGEEWLAGPYVVLGGLATLAQTLDRLADGASPLDGKRLVTRGNRVAVPVLPADALEGALLNGFRGEVWLRPGVSATQAVERAGLAAREPKRTHGIGLVLGAGNVTSIAPLDALYELIAHGRVVLLKLNPTMAEMEDVYRAALAPLLDAGVLRIVQGGAETGAYLTQHPDIAHIHITGSAVTHDAIVWGLGEEGAQRRAAGTPLLEKPISSELGGVSPVIVVPGDWSQADLDHQAAHVATRSSTHCDAQWSPRPSGRRGIPAATTAWPPPSSPTRTPSGWGRRAGGSSRSWTPRTPPRCRRPSTSRPSWECERCPVWASTSWTPRSTCRMTTWSARWERTCSSTQPHGRRWATDSIKR
jgi:aldehyde dehydrogenase (NAD(P)+)